MGQKTHPYGFRLGYNNTWRSRWYADGKSYANLLHEDLQLRQELLQRLENAAVSAVDFAATSLSAAASAAAAFFSASAFTLASASRRAPAAPPWPSRCTSRSSCGPRM